MENFCKFVRNMDDNVRGLLAVAYDNRKKHIGRKYSRITPRVNRKLEMFEVYLWSCLLFVC